MNYSIFPTLFVRIKFQFYILYMILITYHVLAFCSTTINFLTTFYKLLIILRICFVKKIIMGENNNRNH
jgi:hypothetical protein